MIATPSSATATQQPTAHHTPRPAALAKYLLVGFFFGIVLIKAEVLSWYRIQEMFRFQSFHMYGVIGSAVVTGALSTWLLRQFKIRTMDGEPITITKKPFHKGVPIGGLLFGVGWALTGACPGPIFAQIGLGFGAAILVLLSALTGTFCYGAWRDRLPH